jgi:Zn finger protein HypA/HybF involved in hydrogenase expression
MKEKRRNVIISCKYCAWTVQYISSNDIHTLEQIWKLCPECFSSAIDIETGEQIDDKK